MTPKHMRMSDIITTRPLKWPEPANPAEGRLGEGGSPVSHDGVSL